MSPILTGKKHYMVPRGKEDVMDTNFLLFAFVMIALLVMGLIPYKKRQ